MRIYYRVIWVIQRNKRSMFTNVSDAMQAIAKTVRSVTFFYQLGLPLVISVGIMYALQWSWDPSVYMMEWI